MAREILHIAVPAFPIALARLNDRALRNRPVAVAPLTSEQSLLHCVSHEAAESGVMVGTPLFRARRICPGLVVIPPDPILMARGNRALTELSEEFTPVVEPAQGRIFLDVTGSRRLFGPARDVAARLEKVIENKLGLEAKAGTGTNKLVSRIAADVLPEPGVYDVFQGSERSFLAPFPLSVLPGIGECREQALLRDLNLQRVEQLAALAVPQLRLAVGPFATLLHDRACGIDRSPVQLPRVSNEIVEEGFLEQEENDDGVLLSELLRLTESCGLRLRRAGKGADTIALAITYADGVLDQGKRTLTFPLSLDLPLFAAVEELFFATCRRRLRVRGFRLSCRPAQEQVQLDLFADGAARKTKGAELQETLDLLRERHGKQAVRCGRSMPNHRETMACCEPAPVWDPKPSKYKTLTKRNG
ncbi:DNA polymerase IV [Geotalea sp. SG265]|uniref:DNA polymerase Y family protein n=1 Tax=Geotalea sp. SG265 TaxID=2922867 RepID=UPI001FAFD93C|nr:DNA polymerase IV [Geotalea sp. SG265]